MQNKLKYLQTYDQKITLLVRQDDFENTIHELEKLINYYSICAI